MAIRTIKAIKTIKTIETTRQTPKQSTKQTSTPSGQKMKAVTLEYSKDAESFLKALMNEDPTAYIAVNGTKYEYDENLQGISGTSSMVDEYLFILSDIASNFNGNDKKLDIVSNLGGYNYIYDFSVGKAAIVGINDDTNSITLQFDNDDLPKLLEWLDVGSVIDQDDMQYLSIGKVKFKYLVASGIVASVKTNSFEEIEEKYKEKLRRQPRVDYGDYSVVMNPEFIDLSNVDKTENVELVANKEDVKSAKVGDVFADDLTGQKYVIVAITVNYLDKSLQFAYKREDNQSDTIYSMDMKDFLSKMSKVIS